MENPILVNNWRGDMVESCHRGSIVVSDPDGRIIHSWGDSERLVYPRSAVKALQAIPLIESGAADHFSLTDAELALSCSSHQAEQEHIDTIQTWLNKLGLSENDLECGAHDPLDHASMVNLYRQQLSPCRIHNNCSGKHTGMLTTSKFLGGSTAGYIDYNHPAQQSWIKTMGELTSHNLSELPRNYDGCGIPVIALPQKSIAQAFARFASPDDLPQSRAYAVERLSKAIANNPFMIAGSNHVVSDLMSKTGSRLLVKNGAEGVFTATVLDKGIGIAIKIDSGDGIAAGITMLATLAHLKLIQPEEIAAMQEHLNKPVENTRKIVTGFYKPANFY